MVLSIILLRSKYSNQHYSIIMMVVVGVSLASLGEIHFVWVSNFDLLLISIVLLMVLKVGFLLTLLVCFLSSLKSVLTSLLMSGSHSFHPFDLLMKMSFIASIQLLIWGYLLGEIEGLNKWLNNMNSKISLFFMLLLNGVIAFLLNITNFITTKKTSALTVTVAGNVKHIITIITSVIIFQNPISPLNAIGSIIAILGAMLYSWNDYMEKELK